MLCLMKTPCVKSQILLNCFFFQKILCTGSSVVSLFFIKELDEDQKCTAQNAHIMVHGSWVEGIQVSYFSLLVLCSTALIFLCK